TGQSSTGSGSTFSYRPLAIGTDIITLTATDSSGHVLGSTSVTVSVQGGLSVTVTPVGALQPWTLDQVQAAVGNPRTGVTYTFAWSVTGLGGISFSVPGPGTPLGIAGSAFTFKPLLSGSYQVSVTVQGSDGTSGSASQTVAVAPAQPLSATIVAPTGAVSE